MEKLFLEINKIVDDEAPWKQKRDEILQIAKADGELTNLLEFISWFEDVEEM